jgi:hypothetical protein
LKCTSTFSAVAGLELGGIVVGVDFLQFGVGGGVDCIPPKVPLASYLLQAKLPIALDYARRLRSQNPLKH